ncbi:hypothetical protein ACWEFJ_30655 [Actinosynnema sp. NPDC004786]
MDTPRLLKLSFGIRDPPGLCANIHANRIEAAVAAFVGAVQSLAGTVFPPWDDRIVAGHSRFYEWQAGTTVTTLPSTEKNTVPAGKDASPRHEPGPHHPRRRS